MYPNLKLQLWVAGIRQNRFAKMLDIDETQLSKIVNGYREPNRKMRGRIAFLLQSDEDWLFQEVEGRSSSPVVSASQDGGRNSK